MISQGRAGKNQVDSHGNSREREFPSLSGGCVCVQEALLNLAASLISVWQPVNGVDFDEDED